MPNGLVAKQNEHIFEFLLSEGGSRKKYIFTEDDLRNGYTIRCPQVEHGRQLCTLVERRQGVDIEDLFFKCTMDAFGELGFGVKLGLLSPVRH